jgi:hypothetical protein
MRMVHGLPEVPAPPMVAPMTPWTCSGRHHGVGTDECPRRLHHHHDEKCVDPTRPAAPLRPSVVTSRHWTRAGLDQSLRPMELRDGAQPVGLHEPDSHAAMVAIIEHGAKVWRTVCCGPAAPYPRPPAPTRVAAGVARIGDRFATVHDVRLGGRARP